MPESAMSHVVLIDEVDKAPRDFTNDILNEIERQEFYIREQDNYRIQMGADNAQRILVIMTSNSEKNLPEAFLRRCVFYNIEFPGDERLLEILKAQINKPDDRVVGKNLEAIRDLFKDVRKAAVRKPPATAELVAFVKMLEMDGLLDRETANHKAWYLDNLSLMVKTREDIDAIREALKL
jgi:MoxR-like ATPase